MNRGLGLLDRFLPPLALMGLIFFLSAQPDLSSGLGVWDLILRKLAHAISFGLLVLLWFRALRPSSPRALIWAVGVTLLYAISDEFHQTFVQGRHGSPVDVGVDAVGMLVAVLLVRSGRLPAWTAVRRG